jgi:prevent-host-death family protein
MARKPTSPPHRRKPRGLAEPKARPFKGAPATWQIQEAKNRLSELVEAALREGPQEITRHGKSVAVVLSRDEYDRLASPNHKPSLAKFLLDAPCIGLEEMGIDLEAERRRSRARRGDPLAGS